jgi:hypothetical protein
VKAVRSLAVGVPSCLPKEVKDLPSWLTPVLYCPVISCAAYFLLHCVTGRDPIDMLGWKPSPGHMTTAMAEAMWHVPFSWQSNHASLRELGRLKEHGFRLRFFFSSLFSSENSI